MLCKRDAYRGWERIPDLLGLELQVIVNCLMYVLETELESSGRALSIAELFPQPHAISFLL